MRPREQKSEKILENRNALGGVVERTGPFMLTIAHKQWHTAPLHLSPTQPGWPLFNFPHYRSANQMSPSHLKAAGRCECV